MRNHHHRVAPWVGRPRDDRVQMKRGGARMHERDGSRFANDAVRLGELQRGAWARKSGSAQYPSNHSHRYPLLRQTREPIRRQPALDRGLPLIYAIYAAESAIRSPSTPYYLKAPVIRKG